MKRHLFPLMLCAVLLHLLSGCASREEAIAYNNAIVDQQTRVTDLVDAFIATVDRQDSLGAIAALQVTVDSARAAATAIRNMGDYKGNVSLRDGTLQLVEFYATSLDQDFRPLLPVVTSRYSTAVQMMHADSVLVVFEETEDSIYKRVEQEQMAFAKANGFDLTQQ